MTAKSSYDSKSHYSSKTSSRSSSMMNGNSGPYLNIPYPPRHRDTTLTSPNFSSSNSQPQLQPPANLIDLSSNRENRGSAFELYRKPDDSLTRNNYFHGLAPPPVPIADHDTK